MLLTGRFAILDVVRFRMAYERDVQLGDAGAGIAGAGYSIGTGGKGVNQDSRSEFGNEFAVADSAFFAAIGSKKEILPVDSGASLRFSTGEFVEQLRR